MAPRTFTLGQVIAEGHYIYEAADGTRTPVTGKLGCPVPDVGGDAHAWLCPYEVSGMDEGANVVRAMFASDSMQALVLAVHTVPVELAVSIAGQGGRLLRNGHSWRDALSACRVAIEHAGGAFPLGSED